MENFRWESALKVARKKGYKDTIKAVLIGDFNILQESWEQIANGRARSRVRLQGKEADDEATGFCKADRKRKQRKQMDQHQIHSHYFKLAAFAKGSL